MKTIKKVLLLAAAMNVSAELLALDVQSPMEREVLAATQDDLAKEQKNLDAVVKEVEALKIEALAVEQELISERKRHEAAASPEMISKIKELEAKKETLKKQLEKATAVRERLQDELLGVVGSLQKMLEEVNTQEQKKAESESQVSPNVESTLASEQVNSAQGSSEHLSSLRETVVPVTLPTAQEGVKRVVSKKDGDAKEKQEKKGRRRDKKARHSKKRSVKKSKKQNKNKKRKAKKGDNKKKKDSAKKNKKQKGSKKIKNKKKNKKQA